MGVEDDLLVASVLVDRHLDQGVLGFNLGFKLCIAALPLAVIPDPERDRGNEENDKKNNVQKLAKQVGFQSTHSID